MGRGFYKESVLILMMSTISVNLQWKWHALSIATGERTLADCSGWSGRTSYRRCLGNIGATSRLQRMPDWSGTRRLEARCHWIHCPASKAHRMYALPVQQRQLESRFGSTRRPETEGHLGGVLGGEASPH
jgi:hypothetical protein